MKRSRIEYTVEKKIGTAINKYNMISAGDRIIVGVSGGKDSLALLSALERRKRVVPIDYRLKAVHVLTDYDRRSRSRVDRLRGYFERIGCDYVFKKIDIARTNNLPREDCFWCSWNRRKAIFETASESGFNKIALGHHKDDIAETILMNIIWRGEVSSVNPVQSLFNGELSIIRPLVFLDEKEIAGYIKSIGLAVIKSSCPRNRISKRAVVKKVLAGLSRRDRNVKTNILMAPHRIKNDYLEGGLFQ